MNPETVIQNKIMLELSKRGCIIFRNETAGAWVGKKIHQEGQTITLANARMIKAGLAVGSSDLIGLSPSGKFIAIEVKTKTGPVKDSQKSFIEAIKKQGGLAGVARNTKEAIEIVENDNEF